jgi:hypothetical protein
MPRPLLGRTSRVSYKKIYRNPLKFSILFRTQEARGGCWPPHGGTISTTSKKHISDWAVNKAILIKEAAVKTIIKYF